MLGNVAARSDHSGVSDAYEAMKNVASLINESKRRLESVEAIAHWQVDILHWEVIRTLYTLYITPAMLAKGTELCFAGFSNHLYTTPC